MAFPGGRGSKVSVVGAGGWGTGLAKLVAESEHDVTLWCREHEVLRPIRDHGENDRVDMPIVFRMKRLFRGETTPDDVVRELMKRPLKAELS